MLLDTHVWVWLVEDQKRRRLGRKTLRRLDHAAAEGRLYLSSVSAFELAAQHTAGKIHLSLPIEMWIDTSIERGGLRLTDLTKAMAIDGGLIPVTLLSDPIDRMLVASARHLDVPFVTRDGPILDYARTTGQVRVLDAAQ